MGRRAADCRGGLLTSVAVRSWPSRSATKTIRDVRGQIQSLQKRLGKDDQYKSLIDSAKKLSEKLTAIEKKLYQTKNRSSQDPLNFPIRLNNRLSSLVGVVSMGDNPPTRQAVEVRDYLLKEIDQLLAEQREILENELNEFNAEVRRSEVPAIFSKLP